MKTFWTKSGARLNPVRTMAGKVNWLFLPGGPGLGSESLQGLTAHLQLPGTTWLLDLPGDGSNIRNQDPEAFANWSQALIEATAAVENVILVAHSAGGMLVLSTPELEGNLKGLVLIASAPDASFLKGYAEYVKFNPRAQVERLQSEYDANPSDEILKKLTIASAPYVSTPAGHDRLVALIEELPINCRSHLWAGKHFHPTYQAKWVPENIPVLIFAGDQDYLTPLALFRNAPDFRKPNISFKLIKEASHFPWIENPEGVAEVIDEYARGKIL